MITKTEIQFDSDTGEWYKVHLIWDEVWHAWRIDYAEEIEQQKTKKNLKK